MTSYWHTIAIGRERELGSHVFTAEAIRTFAAKYDPQPFHLDEVAAEASLFGGLCASGWHTAAVFMRLNVDALTAHVTAFVAAGGRMPLVGPSPGFRNLRWPRPVYAGERITFFQTVTAKRASASRPGWGVVETANRGINEAGQPVFGFNGVGFIGTD